MSPSVIRHSAIVPHPSVPQMDAVMVFGFCIAFLTVVFLIYRREVKIRWPVLSVLFGASAAYGFLQGAWPLGFLLLALAAAELWDRKRGFVPTTQLPNGRPARHRAMAIVCEPRMLRMFGG